MFWRMELQPGLPNRPLLTFVERVEVPHATFQVLNLPSGRFHLCDLCYRNVSKLVDTSDL